MTVRFPVKRNYRTQKERRARTDCWSPPLLRGAVGPSTVEATSFAGSTLNLIKPTLRRYIYPLKRGGFDFYSLTRVINHQHHFGAIIRNTKKHFSLLSSADVIFPPRTKWAFNAASQTFAMRVKRFVFAIFFIIQCGFRKERALEHPSSPEWWWTHICRTSRGQVVEN